MMCSPSCVSAVVSLVLRLPRASARTNGKETVNQLWLHIVRFRKAIVHRFVVGRQELYCVIGSSP